MAGFPYTVTPNKFRRFFSHVQKAGTPKKVDYKYLAKSGFKSSNDRSIIGILKFVGFLDSSGVPTETWQAYRQKVRARRVLAKAVREAYSELFNMYSDAPRKDHEALRDYFSAHTDVGERALSGITNTFKALCELADFEASALEPVEKKPERVEPTELVPRPMVKGFPININIQLTLPATEDASIYDKLFAALKKHLMSD